MLRSEYSEHGDHIMYYVSLTRRIYLGKCLYPDHILSLVSVSLLLIVSYIKVTKEVKNDLSRKLNVTVLQITFS